MWPTSERFKSAIKGNHNVAIKAEVLQDGVVIYDLTEAGVVIDGSVSASHSATERTGGISLIDRDRSLTPTDIDDLLVPGGNEIRLWRGVYFSDATEQDRRDETDKELIPLGTFRFTNVAASPPSITIHEMYDRSWVVSGEKFENVTTIAAGTLLTEAIESLLKKAMPSVETNFPDTDETTLAMIFEAESDPWEICQLLAANLGMRLFFNQMGVCVMTQEAEQDIDPVVWSFDNTSIEDPSIAIGHPEFDWQGTSFNKIIVIAENSNLATPLRAVATDSDPKSITKYGGKYGRRLAPIIRDEKIATQAQANARAKKELQQQLGLVQQLSINSLVNPAFEIDDLVEIVYEDGDISISQVHIIDNFQVPIRASSSMKLQTRIRQVVTLE